MVVIEKFMFAGVIFERLAGDEKNSHASVIEIGKVWTRLSL
jgi:hypothetical protein